MCLKVSIPFALWHRENQIIKSGYNSLLDSAMVYHLSFCLATKLCFVIRFHNHSNPCNTCIHFMLAYSREYFLEAAYFLEVAR